jgi:hypothetical protein
MASSSQTVKEILESFKARVDARLDVLAQGLTDSLTNIITDGLNDSFRSIQDSLNNMQEIFLMQGLMTEYNQERYAWYDFEDDCDDWYMDSCHFWDDNHFHILFDDSTPPSVENINVPAQELVTSIQSAYSTVELFLPDSATTFSTMWMDLLIWIHMIGVSLWSIIWSWLLGSKIFYGEFT